MKTRDEYYFLTDKLDEVTWALEGDCNDIDCDQYVYKDLLKKKYKPVLEHSFSCIPSLQREREAILRLLSMRKFRKLRHVNCVVCGKSADKLSDRSQIVGMTRPIGEGYVQWKGLWTHKKCAKRVKIPKGWTSDESRRAPSRRSLKQKATTRAKRGVTIS